MKKSILKKIVSVFAVVSMLVTGSTVALADYECASQSSDCNDTANWTVGSTSTITGATHVIENGALKSERTIFYSRSAKKYGFTVDGNAAYLKADTDGNWTTFAENYQIKTIGSTYAFADEQTFTSGKYRAKFDFKLGGGDNQAINVGIRGSVDGSTSRFVGVRISNTNLALWYPTDLNSNPIYYSDDKASLEVNQWYTCTMDYDIDAKHISVTVTGNGVDFSHSETITSDNWGGKEPGAISGIRFMSYYDRDEIGTTEAPEPTSSVWYIDNVELDAGVGYKAENVYSDGAGLVSNAAGTGLSFDGIRLSRLTRLSDPLNASFITAGYDSEGRMTEAVATPLSEVGTALLDNHTVTGATMKSFVLGMDTATPYMAPYEHGTPETTVRKIDFDGDYPDSVKTVSSFTADAVHAYVAPSQGGHTMSIVSEDGNDVLKSERTRFRLTGTPINNYYVWYNPTTKAFEVKKGETGNGYYRVALDESATSIKGSFKIKFAGTDYSSGQQDMQVNLGRFAVGDVKGTLSEYYLRVTRKADGSGALMTNYNTTVASYTGMKADEWYTVEFEYDGTNMKANITGIFGDSTSETTVNGSATKAASSPLASFDYIVFGSHRDMDKAVGYTVINNSSEQYEPTDTAVEGGTNTSVFYIDDIVLEY